MIENNLFFKLLNIFDEALIKIKSDKQMLKLALVNDRESYERKFFSKFENILLNIIGDDTSLVNFYANNNALRRDRLQESARDFLFHVKKNNKEGNINE